MPFDVRSAETRDRLEVRDKPYFARVTDDVHIGYRKGKLKRSWVIRRRTEKGYRTETVVAAVPDDKGVAKGVAQLSFQQMERRVMADKELNCSFCGKESDEVEKLVAGPGVYICNECHVLVGYYMDEEFKAGSQLVLDGSGQAILDDDGKPQFEEAAR